MKVSAVRFSMEYIRAEVRHCLESGKLMRSAPVAALRSLYGPAEWQAMLEEFELCDIRLQDPLADLVGPEEWPDD